MKNKLLALEQKMVTYRNLMKIKSKSLNEELVPITKPILSGYDKNFNDMLRITGSQIYVRETVLEKLNEAQTKLSSFNSNLFLFVTYGYRSLEVQTKLFLQLLSKNTSFFTDPIDLYEEIHRYVAVPTVAGHPTGGAIDILIYNIKTNQFLDFGARQYDFLKEKCYVFSPTISQSGMKNRMLLRKILTEVGFAPFDGEWWHFSYGDKEWAFYYKKQLALYDQLKLSSTKKFML